MVNLLAIRQAMEGPISPAEEQELIQYYSPYGYIPQTSICILFLVLYSLSTSIHAGQAIYYRKWWWIPTVICGGIGEIVGWSGRLWSSHNFILRTPFMIQISTTIFSPTFILAANFIIFGQIINRLGTGYSRLPPRLYAQIFLVCDCVSLIAQAVGGGLAAAALTLDDANRGARIMLGGIVFQLSIIIIYTVLATEFLTRYIHDNPFKNRTNITPRGELTTHIRIMLGGLGFNTLCLFIRAIYRTIELADGWGGRIIRTELYFNVLDGGMITLAIYTFNFIHPGMFLSSPTSPDQTSDGGEKFDTDKLDKNSSEIESADHSSAVDA